MHTSARRLAGRATKTRPGFKSVSGDSRRCPISCREGAFKQPGYWYKIQDLARRLPLHSPMIDFPTLYPLLLGPLILVLVRKWKKPALPYPPGPKGYPILGNVLDLSTSVSVWESITSLSTSYGALSNHCLCRTPEAAVPWKARISYICEFWEKIWSS